MNPLQFFIASLQVLLIGLKLGGVINWNWLAVLFPLLTPIALMLLGSFAGWLSRALETDEERKKRELRDAFDGYRKALERR